MQTYKVRIKGNKKPQTIKANSELEAKVKFCEANGYNYRHLAGKLEVLGETGQARRDR